MSKNKGIKVYLASPFFNEEEIARVKKMEKVLEGRGYDVFSPMRDGVVLKPDATIEERMNTYYDNVRAMDEAELMVAIIETKDTGTTYEHGYFSGRWGALKESTRDYVNEKSLDESKFPILDQEVPRIITFTTDGKPVNVMLLGGILRHCSSWDELEKYLDYMDKVGLEYAVRDMESIGSVETY